MGLEMVVGAKVLDKVFDFTDAIYLKNLLLIFFETGRIGFEIAGVQGVTMVLLEIV